MDHNLKPNKIPISRHIITVVLLLLCAGFFRFLGLQNQGFFFYDEGALIYRANYLDTISQVEWTPEQAFHEYTDAKPLWLLILLSAQKISRLGFVAYQGVSGLFGMATVVLLYFFVYRVFGSYFVATFSAFLLSLFSSHIFYSRVALPEATATFFFLLAIFFYWRSMEKEHRWPVGFGLCLSACLLLDLYRFVAAPVFLFFLEMYYGRRREKPLSQAIWRITRAFLVAISGILIYEIVSWALRYFHIIPAPSFIRTHYIMTLTRDIFHLDLVSLLVYPYFLYQYEGILVFVLWLLSFCFIKNKPSSLLPLIFIVPQFIIFSFPDEKVARSMSIVLPFIAMSCSIASYHVYRLVSRKRASRLVVIGILIWLFFDCTDRALTVLRFRSHMRAAMHYMVKHYGNIKHLTTNRDLANLYLPPKFNKQVDESISMDLQDHIEQGYRLFLADPQSYVSATKDGLWVVDTERNALVTYVESNCPLIVDFPHFHPRLMRYFIFDHTRRSVMNPVRFLERMPADASHIKLYDLQGCR